MNDVVILSGFWLFWPWYFLFLLGSVCQASLFWELVLLHGSCTGLFASVNVNIQKKKKDLLSNNHGLHVRDMLTEAMRTENILFMFFCRLKYNIV